METLKFDYYYGSEAEQYTFYRIPKMLFKDKTFSGLSTDAKLLYGLMLDRMSLSMKNSWLDGNNKVYIIYMISDIMEDLGCAEQKANKILKELDTKSGIGLIERKRQGLGKPNIIYVKNFVFDKQIQTCENHKSDDFNIVDIENQEIPESQISDCENQNTRNVKNTNQYLRKSQGNKTNNNYNNINKPNYSNLDMIDKIDTYDVCALREKICENIEFEIMLTRHQKDEIENIVEIIIELLCDYSDTITIGKRKHPAQLVKDRLLKFNSSCVDYVLDCLNDTPKKIGNIKKYMQETIFNAPITQGLKYKTQANYDFRG